MVKREGLDTIKYLLVPFQDVGSNVECHIGKGPYIGNS